MDQEFFKITEVPSVRQAKMGIAMSYIDSDTSNETYLSDIQDVQIGWAVSPILAEENIEPNAYSSAVHLPAAAAMTTFLLALLWVCKVDYYFKVDFSLQFDFLNCFTVLRVN